MKRALDKLCADLGIVCHSIESEAPATGEWLPGSRHFHVTLTRKVGRQVFRFTISFSQGPAHTKPLTPADALQCLVGDCHVGEQSFEEFCSDMGLDTDSRKAEATHKACQSIAPRLRAFLGDHFDAVASAEH